MADPRERPRYRVGRHFEHNIYLGDEPVGHGQASGRVTSAANAARLVDDANAGLDAIDPAHWVIVHQAETVALLERMGVFSPSATLDTIRANLRAEADLVQQQLGDNGRVAARLRELATLGEDDDG